MLSWNERRLLTKISSWHYLDGWNHEKIAEKINVSRPVVSKLLQKARDTGIIDFYIDNSTEYSENLEAELKEVFCLKYAKVVSTKAINDEVLKANIMKAGIKYLMSRFPSVTSLGMGWGNTMSELVSKFPYHPLEALHIVSLTGGTGPDTKKIHANDLATQLSKKLMCSHSYLYSPFIVDNVETKNELLSIPEISTTLNEGKNVDLAVVGMAAAGESPTLSQLGYLSDADAINLEELKAVGDINSCFFDMSGVEVESSFKSKNIGISLESLRQIPEVLSISYGSHRVQSLYICLKYQLVNSIITDELTAVSVLEMAKG